jgi:hypothetical protein
MTMSKWPEALWLVSKPSSRLSRATILSPLRTPQPDNCPVSLHFVPVRHKVFLLGSALALAVFNPSIGISQGLDVGQTTTRISWRTPSRQSLAIQRQLSFMGSITADSSTETDSRSPAAIFVLDGDVRLDQLAQSLLMAYKDDRYGGVVVRRGSKGELLISNDVNSPAGTISIDRGNQGITTFNVRGQPSSAQLMQAIAPLLR